MIRLQQCSCFRHLSILHRTQSSSVPSYNVTLGKYFGSLLLMRYMSTLCMDIPSGTQCESYKKMSEKILKAGGWHPLLLVMTATMTLPLISSFSTVENTDWAQNHHQLLSTTGEFCHTYIYFGLHIMSSIGKGIMDLLIDLLKKRSMACAFVFIFFVSECIKWAELVEDRLTEDNVPGGVIQTMEK